MQTMYCHPSLDITWKVNERILFGSMSFRCRQKCKILDVWMNCSCTKYPVYLHIFTVIINPLEFLRPHDKSSQADVFSVLILEPNQTVDAMDEGALKTPIPKCRLYWSFLFWVV
jgi:hypothetical protein